jgi:VCBS repeat-containing protein/YD repeat-containing protein
MIDDGNGGTDTATVTITINGANDAPTAADDAASTDEDTAITSGDVFADNGSGADSDPDGDSFTVSEVNGASGDVGGQVTLASGALLTLNANGTFAYDPNDAFEALAVGASDSDSFTYTLSDGNGGTDTATVTITINGANDALLAQNDAAATDEDTPIASSDVFADNGSGADADPDGDSFTVTEVNGVSGAVGSQFTLSTGALLTLNANGTFAYDPNGQFESLAVGASDADSFAYTIADGNGGTDNATVTLTISGVNDAPTDISPNTADVDEGSLVGTAVANFTGSDVDAGDGLTFDLTNDAEGRFGISPAGQLTVASGGLDFETGAGSYNVTIRATDSGGLTYSEMIAISINDVNEAPTDISPNSADVDEGAPVGTVVASFTGSEVDVGDSVTFDLTDDADVRFDISSAGQLTVASSGLDYETATNHNVTIRATDGGGLTYSETVTISVNDLNEAPSATTYSYDALGRLTIVERNGSTITYTLDELGNRVSVSASSSQ